MVKTMQRPVITSNTIQAPKQLCLQSKSTATSFKLPKLDTGEKSQPSSVKAVLPSSLKENHSLRAPDLPEFSLVEADEVDLTKPYQAKGKVSLHEFQHNSNDATIVVLRIHELLRRIGLSRATVYNMINPSCQYFDPVLAACRVQLTQKSVGFIESKVNAWIASHMATGR
jgi:prophage regulatory protein